MRRFVLSQALLLTLQDCNPAIQPPELDIIVSHEPLRLACRLIVVGANKIDLADDMACEIETESAVMLQGLPPKDAFCICVHWRSIMAETCAGQSQAPDSMSKTGQTINHEEEQPCPSGDAPVPDPTRTAPAYTAPGPFRLQRSTLIHDLQSRHGT